MKTTLVFLLLVISSITLFSQYHWEKHPDNPVMVSTEEWEGDYILPRSVIYFDSIYHMWYWGAKDDNSGYPDYPYKEAIGYAISPDGINWTKDTNNPVLEPGPEGAWDDHIIHGCSVILYDSIFHMWYNGHSGQNKWANWGIGHATSPDGINWLKDTDNPVMVQGQVGEWDELLIELNSVIHDGENFQMWYNGAGYKDNRWCVRAGHAISPDGVNWMEDSLNPVLIPEYDWEGNMVFFLNTIFDGSKYKMWYTGGSNLDWEIGYATSDDGSTWEKHDHNPVLRTGPAGSWDQKHVGAGPIIDSAGVKYKMWYVGGQIDSSQRIGYAESSPFVEIPDTAFLHALIDEGVDTNGDSLISYAEAEVDTILDVSNQDITDMTGIEAFINLKSLLCSNNQVTNLNVKNNTALERLHCGNNQLTSLDFTNNTLLWVLQCEENQLTSIDVTENPHLIGLWCYDNQLTSLNVTNNTALVSLWCSNNQLTYLDVTNNNALIGLWCGNNELTSLDLSKNNAVGGDCGWGCNDGLDLSYMPSLNEVCVWVTPFPPENISIDTTGSPNVYFTNECSTRIIENNSNPISIYPNPVKDILHIETGDISNCELEIYSINGILLFKKKLHSNSVVLDISNYKNGLYIVKIIDDNALYLSRLIVSR